MQWSLTLLHVSGESGCVEWPKKIVRTDLGRIVLNYDEVTTIFCEAANIICSNICSDISTTGSERLTTPNTIFIFTKYTNSTIRELDVIESTHLN